MQVTYKAHNGRTTKATKWHVELRDHAGKLQRIATGQTDRRTAEAIGRHIDRLVRCRVGCEPIDTQTSKWLETLNPTLRGSLERIGLVDPARVAALRPLVEHIDGPHDAPGWKQYLAAKGNVAAHVTGSVRCVLRAVNGCNAAYWSDLSSTKLMHWLNGQRQDEVDSDGKIKRRRIGASTFNGYVTALVGFARWMQREGRASDNPMLGLRKLNPKTDKRHERRPYTLDELHWLLTTTKAAPKRYGMTGRERAMLYRVAAETGFRSNELRSLTRASFVLDNDKPSVTAQAAYSKRRRDDVLPLRADTATELRDFLTNKLPQAKAFNMPGARDISYMLRGDLADARNAWLNDATLPQERTERASTSFLCYIDSQGRYADFHALRHTTGTLLAASGVHPKVAQSIMRHSTIELTMGVYSHVLVGQETDAIENLPSLDVAPVRQQTEKTGTDHAPRTPENERLPTVLHSLGQQNVAASGGSLVDEKRRNPNKIVDSVEVSSHGSGRIRTSVGRSPTDLQSVPFGRSGTLP